MGRVISGGAFMYQTLTAWAPGALLRIITGLMIVQQRD
jgi:hypothetical protein